MFRWLLLLVPVSLALAYLGPAPPLLVFAAAIIAIVPLAEWIRRATEQLACALGAAVGGLLNVTFGNVAELLLALFVLRNGEDAVVKGQITGSIIGNGLLGLGLAILVGSWGRERQTFNRDNAGRLSSLLIVSLLALLVPALFHYTEHDVVPARAAAVLDQRLSLSASVVLILVYAANLVYTLVTHRGMFESAHDETLARHGASPAAAPARWTPARALGVLLLATAATAWEAELVSGALVPSARTLGLSPFFLGVVVLAVIGNASEYVAAVYFARRDRMDMVMGITVGSSVQIALLVAPVLVLLSAALGHPMTLVFANPLELVAMAGVAFTVNAIASDGETTWFEGVMLLAVYVLLALAFFFAVPS